MLQTLINPVSMKVLNVTTSIALAYGIQAKITKEKPELFTVDYDADNKQQVKDSLRIIGISVGIALVAGAISGAVVNALETLVEEEDNDEIPF